MLLPSLEPSQGDRSNEVSQHTFGEIQLSLNYIYTPYLEHCIIIVNQRGEGIVIFM